jgi:hypothetical protein
MLRFIGTIALFASLLVGSLGQATDGSAQAIGDYKMDMSQHDGVDKQQPLDNSVTVGRQNSADQHSKQNAKSGARNDAAGYQQYMSQYAGDYQKYMGKGGQSGQSNAGAQGGGADYQQYMKQYAGDYQQYMGGQSGKRENSGRSDVGAKSGAQNDAAGYQQYMKQYAGDYQKYMGGGAQGGKSGAGAPADYQQYMNQYAGDYQKYMGKGGQSGQSNAGAQSGGADYQQYMKQSAGNYQQFMGQGKQSGKDDATAQGGAAGYQSYYKQYMPNAKNKSDPNSWKDAAMSKYAGNFIPHIKNRSNQDEWQQAFRNKYAASYMPHVRNSSNQTEVREAYMKKYAGNFAQYQQQYQHSASQGKTQHDNTEPKARPVMPEHSQHSEANVAASKPAEVEPEKVAAKASEGEQKGAPTALDKVNEKLNKDLASLTKTYNSTKASDAETATDLAASLDQGGASRSVLVMVSATVIGAGVLAFASVRKSRMHAEAEMADVIEPSNALVQSQPASGYLLFTEP